ncbi:MAG TPA: putative lipid II flippase FtsW, partial [Actinomycetota bacterium]|nr:putative lipid II flippase FtsW [Actinomycetota bacterium]
RLRVVKPGEVSPEIARAREERSARRVMATLVVSAAALTVIGLVMVLSASSVNAYAQYGSSFLFFKKQVIYAGVGLVAGLATSRMRYGTWQRVWPPLLGMTVVLLVLVLRPSTGAVVGGSARWIPLGPFSLQPSEVAKFVVVVATAAILARNFRFLSDPMRLVAPLALIVGPLSVLILLQPDLGTTMVILATVALLLFVAGVRLRVLLTWITLALGAGMGLIMSAGYRRVRFFSFLHPWSDPQNTGYQIVQSLIALGSGHLVGVGLGASRQAWGFLPNAHTDFIFAIMGEEVGLVGEVVVLALFGAFVYAGVRIAMKAPDTFGRLLAAGITVWIGFQALVNLGAVTGVLPITGVPLPFVSYGGSSLIVTLAAVGVLASVGRASLWPARRRRSGGTARPERRGGARRPASLGSSRVAATRGRG